MKILHVLRAPIGGLFRHVVDLVSGQIAHGHRVGIIADSQTGNARSDEILAALSPSLRSASPASRCNAKRALPMSRPYGM